MKLVGILVAGVLLVLALVLIIAYICYRMAFYVPDRSPEAGEELQFPEGEIYDVFRDSMEKWAKETRAMPHEEFSVRSFDGLTLWGTFYEYAPGAPMELMAMTVSGLREICGARFTRLAGLLELPGCTAELALDEGILLGGGKELPFREVEVELKEGSEEAVTAFAKSLAAELNLVPEYKSKVARARHLADT